MVLKSYFRCPLPLASAFALIPFCNKRVTWLPPNPFKKKKRLRNQCHLNRGLAAAGSWLSESAEPRSVSGSDAAAIGSLSREAWTRFRVWLYPRQRIAGIISSLNKQQVGIPPQGGTGWPRDPSPTVRKLLLAQSLGNKERFIFCENCRLRVFFFFRTFDLRKTKHDSKYALFEILDISIQQIQKLVFF